MILVYGPDELLVQEVVRDLNLRGQLATAIEPDAHVFSEVVVTRAKAVVGILPHQPRATEDEACEFVTALTQAATAPSAPRVVLVTPAPNVALHLQILKRSGAPYVVVSSEALAELVAPPYLPKRPVWMAREVLRSQHTVATEGALLAAIAEAVEDNAPVGVEREPEKVCWDVALQEVGVRVRVVPGWMARLAGMCRQPVVYEGVGGKVVMRLGYEPIAQALGALPREATA